MENKLVHSGVLGMKWGIRLYQNKDGTLTEAGKQHYSRLRGKYVHKTKDMARQYHKKSREILKNADNTDNPDSPLSNAERAKINEDFSKNWLAAHDELMKMPIDSLKTRKEYREFISDRISKGLEQKIYFYI